MNAPSGTMGRYMGFNEGKFAEYLLYDVLVRKGTEVYYIYWVKQFLRGYDAGSDQSWQEQLEGFLGALKKSDGFQEWQANQAERAVRTYFNGFRKQSPTLEKVEDKHLMEQVEIDPEKLLARFRENLRSQNCGASTEQIYLGWVRRYLDYLKRDGIQEKYNTRDLESSVARFLGYLADEKKEIPSVRKQAFNALMIFFSLVMDQNISGLRYLLDK